MKKDVINLFLKNRQRSPFVKPIIIAHRGASGYAPENTLAAFKKALEMGSRAIEIDVFVCKKDNNNEAPPVVVIHDETIDRTTNGHGLVKDIRLKQLKKYNAGNGERVPLLSEVLNLFDRDTIKDNILIDIDLKGSDTPLPVANMVKHYIDYHAFSFNNFIVTSFDLEKIREIRTYSPYIKTGANFYQSDQDLIKATQEAQAQYLILDYESVTYNLIARAHAQGLLVFVYTVNDTAIAEELATWHVDGIMTDYPDILDHAETDPHILH